MIEFTSRYVAHQPDSQGYVQYSQDEHRIWRLLFERQIKLVPEHASDAFQAGLNALALTAHEIPQLPIVSHRLTELTGWRVEPVAALISARAFFELLADKAFPSATFIRCEEELDYIKEPDIFHELFGHCPLLTDPTYAGFVHDYARLVLTFPESDWPLLQRLFWFTVEFGLIKTDTGLRAYGGGILSSASEMVYSVKSHLPIRAYFDPLVMLRTPYRIDQLQSIYFVIEHYQALYALIQSDLRQWIKEARALGEYPPLFSVEDHHPSIHIHAC